MVGYCWLIFRKHGKVNQSIKLVPCSVFRNVLILLSSGCLNGKRIQNKTQTVRSFSGVMANCLKPTQMIRRENEYIMLETRENARNRSQKMCIRGREPIMHHTQNSKNKKRMPTTIQVLENNMAEKKAVDGYRLIDMTILAKLIGELSCPEC